MSSAPRRRPKPGSKSPIPEDSSSSFTHSSITEPPQNLFPSKEEFLRLIVVLAIAASVALTCNFIAGYFNPTMKRFCDSNSDSPDSLSDFCEPCPRHGECNQGSLECAQGYRKVGNICVEDGDINERSDWVENRLCEAYAQLLCFGTGTIWVREDDIWNDLDGHQLMETFGSDSAVHMHTKKRAMETIGGLLETRENSLGKKELKCPDMLAAHYKPYTCRIRQWISKHAIVIASVCVLVVGSTLLLLKVQQRRCLATRGEELYRQEPPCTILNVCEILEENALMSTSVNSECERWVVASRLRDHLLLPKERKNLVLWKKVEELVQEDSRIDRYPKLVKGESKEVWEWQVEGSLSSARMRKRRESGKLNSGAGIEANSYQHHHALKCEPRIPTS